MSTTELSDVFEFQIKLDPSQRADDVQPTLDAAIAEAVQQTAAVTRASAELQATAAGSEAVVLLHVVLARGSGDATPRSFVESGVTSQLAKRRIVVSEVTQRNTSGDN
jgi:hypothetical protein